MLDRALLMERVGDDEKLLLEITDTFLQESAPMMQQLNLVLQEGDIKKVERLAHTLKGAMSIFGLDSATDAAFQLEAAARAGKSDDLESLYKAVVLEHTRLGEELVSLKASLGKSASDTES